jgi:general secretion pathway protein D
MRRKFGLLVSIICIGAMAASLGAQQAPDQPTTETEATPPAETIPAQPPARPRARQPAATGDQVSLNFSRADLVEVVHVLAQHLRLTYTIDPDVKGTVTIYSAEPLRKDDLFPVFHQILRMNNAAAVKTGNLYRISTIKDGKGLAGPVARGREDNFVLQVVPVRFFSVAEMKKLLTPFVTSGGEILDFPRGNFLIIMDLPSNIQRLVEIRDLIDVNVFAGTRMEIYQPKVAIAEEMAAEMTKIMQAYASSAAQSEGFAAEFLAIPRINQLLVINHSEAAWTYVKRWLERIDTVGEGPGRRIFIYPVENGKATDLADILNQVLGHPLTARREAPRTLEQLHRGTPLAPGAPGGARSQLPSLGVQQPALGPQSMSPDLSVPFIGAAAPVPAQPLAPAAPPPGAAVPRLPAVPAPPTRPSEPRPEEQLRIVPDPATNSLIIFGTTQEFQNIKNILKEIDIMPRQVLMDVLVAEVTLADDLKFGVEYEVQRRAPGGTGDVRVFDRTFTSRGSILSGLGAPTATGVGPSGLNAVIGTGNAIRSFINALMADSRVKILSSPTILATDNRPARIQVGSEEPIATGTITGAVGTVASSTTIQYRNTGRIVTIIPQVNSRGLVNLQMLAEVSQRGGDVQVGSDKFPSFDTRQAETTAVVHDGDTLVIGGIITDRKSRGRVGIPFLMDIPVLGRFFGTTTDEVDRTELIMLITPHVIRDRQEAKSVTEEFKERLSTVTKDLEKRKKEAEEQKTPLPKSPSPASEKESRVPAPAFREASVDQPQGLENGVRTVRLKSEYAGNPVTARRDVVEEERDIDVPPAPNQPEIEFGDVWRGLLKVLTLGLY